MSRRWQLLFLIPNGLPCVISWIEMKVRDLRRIWRMTTRSKELRVREFVSWQPISWQVTNNAPNSIKIFGCQWSQRISKRIRYFQTMKLLAFFLLIIPILSSCKKKIGQFDMDYNSEVVVPSTFGQLVPFTLYTPEMQTNAEYEFESNNTKKKYIQSIYAKQIRLDITSPQNETFSFLNEAELFISSPNVTERKVAYVSNVPNNVGNTLNCGLLNVDLQEYIKEDQFKLRLVTTTDETIPQDVTINIYTNFRVDAKLLK